MTKKRKILLCVLLIPAVCLLLLAAVLLAMPGGGPPAPPDYDDPESLWRLAERTERYIIRADPDKNSPARQEALKALEDIALLDIPDNEKSRRIRERFPEESFWPDELKELLQNAEAGDSEAQFRLGCFYAESWIAGDFYIDPSLREARRGVGKAVIRTGALAAKWFRRAALQGHMAAQSRLAESYRYRYGDLYRSEAPGHPLSKNKENISIKAREQIEREIDEWFAKAWTSGDLYARCRTRMSEDDRSAVLQAAAEQGDVEAMLRLGLDALIDSDSDLNEAAEWYGKAVELGSAQAMWEYATLCDVMMREDESASDPETVQQWRQKAFDTAMKQLDGGNAEPLYELTKKPLFPLPSSTGALDPAPLDLKDFLGGEGEAAFMDRLTRKLWALTEQGDCEFAPRLINFLRHRFHDKAGFEEMESGKLRRRFSELGFFCEQLDLAVLGFGSRTQEENAEAFRVLRKLAGFGMPAARCYLGTFYVKGVCGAPKDRAAAYQWLRKAADQRHAMAMMVLSEWYRTGSSKNVLKSAYWSFMGPVTDHGYDSIREFIFSYLTEKFESLLDIFQ